jgi:hypothetical protein
MNAASNSKPNFIGIGIGLIVFVGVVVGLYYLYKFLYDPNAARKRTSLWTGTLSLADCKVSDPLADKQKVDPVKGLADGGEFTISSWLYVADVRQKTSGGPIHLFEISQRDYTKNASNASDTNRVALLATLSPQSASLKVQLGTPDSTETLTDRSVATFLTTDTGGEKCKLNTLEYQRWLLITCVVNSRTLDIYIDGKLARSCVYNQPYKLQTGTNQKILFGMNNGSTDNLRGFLANPVLTNYAMSPDEVYRLYMAGPDGGNSILDWIKSYFSVNVTFKAGDQTYSV